MTDLADDAYRLGRQRIVQIDKHDHAIGVDDERTLCDKYGVRAVVVHDVAFVPYANHACDECSRLLTEAAAG
jgi:hypothetical protein